MIGAIAGDIVGSAYEGSGLKRLDFPLFGPNSRFTDDSVLTVAVADAILGDGDYLSSIRRFGRRYPSAGYGGTFFGWLFQENPQPYNSWGNGSAMRVSPVGFAFDREEDVLEHARRSAIISHDHPEGIKGAQATALSVFLCRSGCSKHELKNRIMDQFGYNLDRALDQIRPDYHFDVSCQGSVPESLIAFLESNSVESAIRNAVSLGGDADTMACIAGAVAEAFHGGVPEFMIRAVQDRLPPDLWDVTERFCHRYR